MKGFTARNLLKSLTQAFSWAISPSAASRRVGFWRELDNPFSSLPDPQRFVDTSWDPKQRRLVLAHLRDGKKLSPQFGFAPCRFADCVRVAQVKRIDDGRLEKRILGHMDLGCCDVTDGIYTWPEGFEHYIEIHAVKPPRDFIDHCIRCETQKWEHEMERRRREEAATK
jgi:hypothetical protein